MSSEVTIGPESAGRRDERALLLAMSALSAARYPPESRHGLDLGDYARPEVALLVARSDGVAVGCGAYLLQGDGSAELKSMFVAPEARGRGIGWAVLAAIEAALHGRVTTLCLETGSAATAATHSACSWRSRWRERSAPREKGSDPFSL